MTLENLKTWIRGKWDNLLVSAGIIFLLFLLHGSQLSNYPNGVHAWANMDRIALARGFERNNLNFFQAQNYLLNHQYPSFWHIPSESTRTAVEFPIHDYIPAVFMKLFDQHGPEIFHLYVLFMSFLGLFYLYKWTKLLSGNTIKSSLVVLFVALTPVYVFYQGGFIPTIPSISLAILALYNYSRYYQNNEIRFWNYAILCFTLTILARSTYAIPFIAVLGFEGFRVLRTREHITRKLLSMLIAFGIIAVSLAYNASVRKTYGSDFLSELLPAKSWADIKRVAQIMYDNWRFSYLTFKHYLLLVLFAFSTLISILLFRRKIDNKFNKFWFLLLIWLLGVVAFWLVMNQQFVAHDYYFLDTFFLPIVLFVQLALCSLPNKFNRVINGSLALLLGFFVYFTSIELTHFRKLRAEIAGEDRISGTLNNFIGSEAWLDKLGVSKSAKIMVLHAYGPNIPFVLMNRIGYAVKEIEAKSDFENVMGWNWDYIIVQKRFFEKDVYPFYPEILKQIVPVANNENLILCKRKKAVNPIELTEFLGYTNVLYTYHTDFKKKDNRLKAIVYKKNFAAIESTEQFGLQMDFTPYYRLRKTLRINLKLTLKSNFTEEIPYIFAIDEGKTNKYYQGITVKTIKDSIVTTESSLVIPAFNYKNTQLHGYLYNPGNRAIDLYECQISILTD